jgi:hypothetical protein
MIARRVAPVAVVTGAAKGIGRAIAHRLADDGWRLVPVDSDARTLAQAFARRGRSVATVAGDVADPAIADRAVRAAVERFGRLDALVSNAGMMIRKPPRKLTLEEWRRVLDVNLTAAFLFARAAEKPLRATKGAIVTIASTRATMSEPNTEAYAATKGGLVALTHALAMSFAPDIRVNCISPGWIRTTDYSKLRRKDHAQHPAGRVGRVEDVAEAAAFLLDRERAGFITGANLVVDGGMTRKMIYAE